MEGTKPTSHALIGRNPLNQGVVDPTINVYIMSTWTKVHYCQKIEHYSKGPIPYGTVAVGCTTASRLSPLRRCRLWFECASQRYDMKTSLLHYSIRGSLTPSISPGFYGWTDSRGFSNMVSEPRSWVQFSPIMQFSVRCISLSLASAGTTAPKREQATPTVVTHT
jgi:hypothetical protein